ncbi:MAG: SMI1/KNR4 family protein [Tannerella sp.]|jgi:hypothetical protein|nr:SMI1/KNR4 family protein [Tannerella sp.]
MELFKNKELLYEGIKSNLSLKHIKGVINVDFVGVDSFINLYQIYDGVKFLRGAMMFRNKFYDVLKGEWDKIEVEFFLTFKNIRELMEMTKENNPDIYLLAQTHVPFADDGCGNTIWIEMSTGKIKVYYHEYELDKGLLTIAPNFNSFCSSLENWVL